MAVEFGFYSSKVYESSSSVQEYRLVVRVYSEGYGVQESSDGHRKAYGICG